MACVSAFRALPLVLLAAFPASAAIAPLGRVSAPLRAPARPSLAVRPAHMGASRPLALAAARSAAPASIPALAASGVLDARVGDRDIRLLLRRGVNSHGHQVMAIDALDRADLSRGTVGHVDFSINGRQASGDLPVEGLEPHGQPEELIPADADLSHWRPHLWFGLAVHPDFRRKGLAHRLMDERTALLRHAGVRRLFIRSSAEARAFHRAYFKERVVHEEAEPGEDGEIYYRLEIEL